MLWYCYNNMIIIIINVVILTFLSARFAGPGALQLTIFFKHELEHKNNES